MIPHIIHYCWFGKKEKPKKIREYINGWKKLLPDFQFMEWNEKNFPIDYCHYTKEAYEIGKYAFVSDVARLYGLYHYGGVYLDTDVEILKRFDEYLNGAKMVFSMESSTLLMSGFMAGEKKSEIFRLLLEEYTDRSFINPDGTRNCVANTVYLTEIMKKHGLIPKKQFQNINHDIYIYDYTVFGAFNADTSKFNVTDKTVLIHHCVASWGSPFFKVQLRLKKYIAKLPGGGVEIE